MQRLAAGQLDHIEITTTMKENQTLIWCSFLSAFNCNTPDHATEAGKTLFTGRPVEQADMRGWLTQWGGGGGTQARGTERRRIKA